MHLKPSLTVTCPWLLFAATSISLTLPVERELSRNHSSHPWFTNSGLQADAAVKCNKKQWKTEIDGMEGEHNAVGVGLVVHMCT